MMSGMTIGYTMNLANSIIGVGILAMPFCFQKCGILLSTLLLILSNLMTRLTCNYLLQSSIRSRRRNFESMALHIFGSSGKLLVELSVIGYLFGSCVTYNVVIGDLGPQILSSFFDTSTSDSTRTVVMVVVSVVCIIPLSLLRNMESLSHVSTISIIFYFCMVLKIVFDSEEKITSNYWIDNIHWWRPSGVLQCLPIFCMSLSCQTQMFEVYESLPNQSLEKMNRIVKAATNICTGVYILVGVFGYVAYSGQEFSGNILLSFAPSLVTEIIKLGFVLSVAFSFPLMIFPCRASLYSLFYHRSHSEVSQYIPEHRFQFITVFIVAMALIIGILIPSIELVIGLVGSTIGVAICIMFPASCFIKTNKKGSTEKLLAQFLLVFAFGLMILGTFANLEAIDEKQAEIHEIPAVIPVVDHVPFMEKLPQSVEDIEPAPQASDSRAPSDKRKPNKTHNILPVNQVEQIVAPVNISVREVDLHDAKPNKDATPDHFKPDVKIEHKMMAKVEKIVAEPDKSANAKIDSSINKDAIQKEEQEIAIEAKEEKQKNLETAKELLNEVKSEWVKQNEETQKLVLEKIDKISEKMDEIEHFQKEEKHRESASPKKQDEKLAPVPVVDEHKVIHIENEKKNAKSKKQPDEKPTQIEVLKNIPHDAKVPEPEPVKDPIVASILPKLNAVQKPNADQPGADSADRIGRELLSSKDMLSRSRSNRGSEVKGDDEENDKMKKIKTIQIKTVEQINLKGRDFNTELEVKNTDEDQPDPDTNDKKLMKSDDGGIKEYGNQEHRSERDVGNDNNLRSL